MDLKNKRILITGGTGFIGSAIANKLLDQEISVNIITHADESMWRINKKNKCNCIRLDLSNFSKVKKYINKIQPDLIFHLAAYVNPERDYETIEKAYSVNFLGTKNLILSLNDYNYDLFINTGTCEEYGNIEAPFKEIDREKPVSPYSASKIAATYFCELISDIYNKPIITVRPFLTYGPKQLAKLLIPSLIFSGIEKRPLSLTPCNQTRDIIYIDDVVDAYISLAKNCEKIKNRGIFNIGTGEEIKIIRIVSLIKSKLENTDFRVGVKKYRKGEAMRFYSSVEKINKTIGWKPKWTIEEGIDKTIEWWLNNKEIWKKFSNIWT